MASSCSISGLSPSKPESTDRASVSRSACSRSCLCVWVSCLGPRGLLELKLRNLTLLQENRGWHQSPAGDKVTKSDIATRINGMSTEPCLGWSYGIWHCFENKQDDNRGLRRHKLQKLTLLREQVMSNNTYDPWHLLSKRVFDRRVINMYKETVKKGSYYRCGMFDMMSCCE